MNRQITPVVLGLIVINIMIHLAVLLIENQTWQEVQLKYMRLWKVDTLGLHEEKLATPDGSIVSYDDIGVKFNPVQPLGAAFAHSPQGIFHILLNMMCLYFFGPSLERHMGSFRFLLLYLFSAIVGGFIAAFFDPIANPALGASGAISGLLVAFAWLFPESRMGLMFIPYYIRSRTFMAGFAMISLFLVVYSALPSGRNLGGISHFGHLAGMVAGAIFMVGYRILGGGKRSFSE